MPLIDSVLPNTRRLTFGRGVGPRYGQPNTLIPNPTTSSSTATNPFGLTGSMGKIASAVEGGLTSYGAAAAAGQAQEEGRGAAMEQYLRSASDAANVPTITQSEIDRRFARSADAASGTFLDNMAGLRDYMGSSGITGGGMPAGIGANYELQRLGQLTQARSDLMSFKATQDALDRQKAFDRAQVVGQAINRPISMLNIDFENQKLQTRLSELGIESNLEGQKAMAKANKKSSSNSLIGSIIGGAGSLIGGLL